MTHYSKDPGDRGQGIDRTFYESYIVTTARELLVGSAHKLLQARNQASSMDRTSFSARFVETAVESEVSKVPSSRLFFERPAKGIVPHPLVDSFGGVEGVEHFEIEIPTFFEGVVPQAIFISILRDGITIHQAVSEQQIVTFDPDTEKVKVAFHDEKVLLEKTSIDDQSDDVDPSKVRLLKDFSEDELGEHIELLNLHSNLINYYLLASRPKFREASA